ncbi:MAG: Gfo/Idh/MocA family oxidoreductase [Ginsengibacter sp.]
MQFNVSLPKEKRPIVIIGAGGIVNDAHLPAYQIAEFEVAGIYDINIEKAENTAKTFSIPVVYKNMDQLLVQAPADVVFDLALPGNAITGVLQKLPDGAAVLIQKPMGENFEQAKNILQLTREKRMVAGVNFQLRYAPFIIAARKMINEGIIGDLCDIEVNVNVYTPWHLWDFLFKAPRVEIPYHSIHYIDLVRSFLGNPKGIYAKTVKHPQMRELASVKSNIIMDYGDFTRANILTNHCHQFGLENQQSYVKFEGTKGAIKIRMGVLLNYPTGVPDVFEYITIEKGKELKWQTKDIEGSWFPHAFIGSMSEIMKAAEGSIRSPDNSVEDSIYTMACVEAAYESSVNGAIKPDI